MEGGCHKVGTDYRGFKQCSFKYIAEPGTFIIGRLTMGLCSGAVRGVGGREGGQEEDKEVALVDPYLHRKWERKQEGSLNTL